MHHALLNLNCFLHTLENEFSCANQVFRQTVISFTKPPLHERRQSVGKMVGIAVEMKSARGDLQWRELGWKSAGWKAASLKQEGEFIQLNLRNKFQYLTSFNSCYHFQDVNSLCHKQYLFSQHPSGCASPPDTEGWMKNSHCLRKTLSSPCQSLWELTVLTAVRWKYGPINSAWHLFSIA